jgi:hypothetical protein
MLTLLFLARYQQYVAYKHIGSIIFKALQGFILISVLDQSAPQLAQCVLAPKLGYLWRSYAEQSRFSDWNLWLMKELSRKHTF